MPYIICDECKQEYPNPAAYISKVFGSVYKFCSINCWRRFCKTNFNKESKVK